MAGGGAVGDGGRTMGALRDGGMWRVGMVCVCVCVCGGIRKGVCVWVGVGLCAGAGGGAGFTRRAEMACPATARRRQWQLRPWGSSPAAAGGGGAAAAAGWLQCL